ncbi:MAG: methyl-accepting chemotaxis protein [Neomegalonema sp.]|nr:methyl-accepting chemotaxis protein [Neomegalonema sp.]
MQLHALSNPAPVSGAVVTTARQEEQAEIARALEAAANGNFSVRIEGDDPLSRAARALIARCAADSQTGLEHCVTFAIGANQTGLSCANLLINTEDLNLAAQEIAVGMEEIATSIQQTNESVRHVRDLTQEMTARTREGQEHAAAAVQGMSASGAAVGAAFDRVNGLQTATHHIDQIVETIANVAQQTSMLAVNASIEAARAGAAGRGFSIVAQEVKSLSEQTAKATDMARQRMSALREEVSSIAGGLSRAVEAVEIGATAVQDINQRMRLIAQGCGQIEGDMVDSADALGEQATVTQSAADKVTAICGGVETCLNSTQELIAANDTALSVVSEDMARYAKLDLPAKVLHLAKADHVIWKKRLADMFAGRLNLDPGELSSHHSCRLGKWYAASGAELYGDLADFKALEHPHRVVHSAGVAAAEAFMRGDRHEAFRLMGIVESASVEVIRLLDRLIASGR